MVSIIYSVFDTNLIRDVQTALCNAPATREEEGCNNGSLSIIFST